jgi:hypothetical protein
MANHKAVNRKLLYHLLPAVFWLLAIGGSLLPLLPITNDQSPVTNDQSPITNYLLGYAVSLVALLCILIVSRIKRHTNSVEECFVVALLLGVAAYWLPTVILLLLPIWGYLIYRNLFSFKSFMASLIGLATVGIWLFVLYQSPITNYLSPITTHQSPITNNLSAWIPLGAVLLAWLASAVTRHILQER